MSAIFFDELQIPRPDCNLGIGSGSHGAQTGRMLEAIEQVIEQIRPRRVLVYGDTNSTLAGALAASKLRVPVDHVEAGLRSFDRDMPEELNRVLTDQLADQLFCPTQTAVRNLAREGITDGVQLAGDVMLDLAIEVRPRATSLPLPSGIKPNEFFLATIHRPSNTDDREHLSHLLDALADVSHLAPVLLPIHPRLANRLHEYKLSPAGIRCIEPASYLEMQGLLARARGVITDSGGVQKEALFHGIQCVTLRDSTEWIESVEAGMNRLIGQDFDRLVPAAAACHGRTEIPRQILDAFGGGRAGAAIAGAVRMATDTRRRWARSGHERR